MTGNSSTPPTVTVSLGCSKCGASLPDDAQFCLKCGKPVAAQNCTDVEVIPPERPRPKRGKRQLFFRWLLAAVLCFAGIVWLASSDNPAAQVVQNIVGWKHDRTVLDSSFTIGPHAFRYYKFSLPEGSMNVAVMGEFSVSFDSSATANRKASAASKSQSNQEPSEIQVYVLSESAFTIWQNGYETASLYDSGKTSEGKVAAEIPDGAAIYYLVFSNKSDQKTSKSVRASVILRYKSWLPDSLRRIEARVLNWVGL
jgi:zinc-ribbon domain